MERELELLLSRSLDGVLSPEDEARLETLLNENAEFRAEFLAMLRYERISRTLLDVDGGLDVAKQVQLKVKAAASGETFVQRIHNEVEKKKLADNAKIQDLPRARGANRFFRFLTVIAAMLALAVLLFLALNRPQTTQTVQPEIKPEPKPAQPEKKLAQTPVKTAEPTFVARAAGEYGSPSGYWEFLPSAYHNNPTQRLAMVIFFHGIEEGGDGSVENLKRVLKNGPPAILADAAHPLHDYFEKNNVIVLCPQGPPRPQWWHSNEVATFMDFAFKLYGKQLDRRRVYLTGLSAGALGIHDLMDTRPEKARLAAGILVTATVGGAGLVSEPFAGANVGAAVPYWALTSIGDNPNETIAGINKIAGVMNGKLPTDLIKNHPDPRQTYTASFNPKTGWIWQKGTGGPADSNLRLTLYPGGSHASFTLAYDNIDCWNWLLSQQAPGDGGLLEKF